MSDDKKHLKRWVSDALDLMVQAGWVHKYVCNVKTGMAIDWTDKGKEEIAKLWETICELGVDSLTAETWWAVRMVANMGRPR